MDMIETFINTAINYGWIALTGIIAWTGKVLWKKNEELSRISTRVSLLEDNLVREDKVKIIIREVLQPYLDDQAEMKESLKTIAENVVQLRIDTAAQNAARSNYESKRDNQ